MYVCNDGLADALNSLSGDYHSDNAEPFLIEIQYIWHDAHGCIYSPTPGDCRAAWKLTYMGVQNVTEANTQEDLPNST